MGERFAGFERTVLEALASITGGDTTIRDFFAQFDK